MLAQGPREARRSRSRRGDLHVCARGRHHSRHGARAHRRSEARGFRVHRRPVRGGRADRRARPARRQRRPGRGGHRVHRGLRLGGVRVPAGAVQAGQVWRSAGASAGGRHGGTPG